MSRHALKLWRVKVGRTHRHSPCLTHLTKGRLNRPFGVLGVTKLMDIPWEALCKKPNKKAPIAWGLFIQGRISGGNPQN
jgi:hypothetical protein